MAQGCQVIKQTLNIYNLDCEYVDEHGKTHYPFTDPIANPRGIIYTEGKAVKRAAFLPQPRKWIERFNLRDVPQDYWNFMNEIKSLNGYEQKKAKVCKLAAYGHFLRDHGFTFTAYNLRHFYLFESLTSKYGSEFLKKLHKGKLPEKSNLNK